MSSHVPKCRRRMHPTAEEKERVTAMQRYKKHVEMEEQEEKESAKLDQLRSKIRQARDTKKIISRCDICP